MTRKSYTVRLGMAAAVIGFSSLISHPALAFNRYNDGCQTCHGKFTDGTSTKDSVFLTNNKHEMHRASNEMNTHCDLCHTSGDQRNPFIGSSNGTANNPGAGCTGCHGRFYDVLSKNSGVGLRAHHAANDQMLCMACHPGDPAPLPESVAPVYYGTVDTNVDDPCNSGPFFKENWTINDLFGLDNDGDNLYDGNDPDCSAAPVAAIAWRSVRTHGNGLGPLAIQLDPTAVSGPSVVSETRNGGVQLIEVDFDQAVVLTNPGGITVTDAGGGIYAPAAALVDTDTLAITFPQQPSGALPDQKCYLIDLDSCVQNAAGVPLAGDTDCKVRGLVGDVNNDENANLIDMAFAKSKNGQPVLPANIRFDVNVDGSLNLIDMALVKSKNGNLARCP